jgi:hypothetical protein
MTAHHYLTLDKKMEFINDHADGDGLSQRKLFEKCKVPKGAVYNILQRKDEYKYNFQMNANKLTDAYIDSKTNKESSIMDYSREA